MPYWTVVIPYEPDDAKRTLWHPSKDSLGGPFETLTRGAFKSNEEAHDWAREHLGRSAHYEVRHIETREERFARMLSTFAYHCRTIGTEAPGKFGLGLGHGSAVVHVDVEIKQRNDPERSDPVWDSVYIDGECCGNRAGGTDEYARRVAAIILKAATEE